jgi:hypothetical protein
MAIILLGKSLCPLCNEVMRGDQELKAFPAFLPYDHRFGKFSDAGFHKACFEKHPDAQDVDMMLYVWTKIMDGRPKDLKTVEEIEIWAKDAFQDWPPKNGVVVYEQVFTEDGSEAEWWWADKDSWEEFERVEAEEHEKMKERHAEALREEREAWRYTRDDDY